MENRGEMELKKLPKRALESRLRQASMRSITAVKSKGTNVKVTIRPVANLIKALRL